MMEAETGNWFELLELHLDRYPQMKPRDVYKLFFQGIMGPEHFISSVEDFSRWLKIEFSRVLPNPAECITEPVRPDQSLLRINLRPYKAQQLQVDQILTPLLDTARSIVGDRQDLRSTWMGFVSATQQGRYPGFDQAELNELTSMLESQEYPAISHSKTYRQQYQPAYRLIVREYIKEIGLRDDC